MTSATIAMKLKPWTAPNFVQMELPPGRREDGPKELPSISVKDLPAASLDALASEWLKDLYEKAGQQNRWTLSP